MNRMKVWTILGAFLILALCGCGSDNSSSRLPADLDGLHLPPGRPAGENADHGGAPAPGFGGGGDGLIVPNDEPNVVRVFPERILLGRGEGIQFSAYATDEKGWPQMAHFHWSLQNTRSSDVGVLSREGTFIAQAAGQVEVVAEVDGEDRRGSAKVVVVEDDQIAHFNVTSRADYDEETGEIKSYLLAAVAFNGAGDPAPGLEFQWSMDEPIGAFEEAPPLTQQELEATFPELRYPFGWWGYYGGGLELDSGEGTGAVRSRHYDLLPETVSLKRFIPGAEGGQAVVTAAVTDPRRGNAAWSAATYVYVTEIATLSSARLDPADPLRLHAGEEAWLWVYPSFEGDGYYNPQLEYAWSVEGEVGTLSIPQDYDPNTAKQIRVLTAGDQEAQGTVTVAVTDPIHGVTATASLEVQVVATQRLAAVTVYPDRVSLRPNQAKALTAQALDELGDPIAVKFEWTLIGDLGSLKEPADDEWASRQEDPTDDPEGTGEDGTEPGGDGTEPGGDVVIAPPPEPSDDASLSTRFFVSDDRTGAGEIVVTATDANGSTAEARVAVEVRE